MSEKTTQEEVTVTNVEDNNDGTYTVGFDIPDPLKEPLIELGLKYTLYCAAFDLTTNEAFNFIKDKKELEEKYREAQLTELSALAQAQEAYEGQLKAEKKLKEMESRFKGFMYSDFMDELFILKLKDNLDTVEKDLEGNQWHPDDRPYNKKVKKGIKAVLDYYGE